MKKVLCCIPLSWKYVSAYYHISALEMNNYGIRSNSFDLHYTYSDDAYLDHARDALAKTALNTDIEYFLWIDADQVYPRHTPAVLIKHVDSGKLVVGGVTPNSDDGTPHIFEQSEDKTYQLIKEKPLQALAKRDAMGMGGVMTHRSVFEKLKPPYFMLRWRDDEPVAETFSFYERCKEAGIDLWCDTDLRYAHMDTRPVHLIEGEA